MAFTFAVQQFRLHTQVRIYPLQSTDLSRRSLHLADQGCVHTAILRSPHVERHIPTRRLQATGAEPELMSTRLQLCSLVVLKLNALLP